MMWVTRDCLPSWRIADCPRVQEQKLHLTDIHINIKIVICVWTSEGGDEEEDESDVAGWCQLVPVSSNNPGKDLVLDIVKQTLSLNI